MTYNLRNRNSKQLQRRIRYNLRPRPSKQLQGSGRTINDAPEEEPIPQELLVSSHHLDDSDFLDNFCKKSRTERVVVSTLSSQESTSSSSSTASWSSVPENPSSDEDSDHEQISQVLPPNEEAVYDQALENPSSNEEYVHEEPDLTMLKPPSGSGGFSMEKEHLHALKLVSLVLISDIKKALNASKVIYLSSKAFAYFDSIGVDYTPVYRAVCSVIRHHCDKEAMEKQKPQAAFDTKAAHDQAASELSKAKERCTAVNRELADDQHELGAIIAHINGLDEELKKAEEEKARLESKAAAAREVKVTCEDACNKAQSRLEKTTLEMNEAQKAFDGYESCLKEAVDGSDRAMEELWSLRASLQ